MWPSAIATTTLAMRKARTTSPVIITRLRGTRSVTTPAAKPNSAHGRMRAKPTIPAFAGECVTARTSSGYAIPVDSEPIVESTCPDWSRMKSRFLLSGFSEHGLGLDDLLRAPGEEIGGGDRVTRAMMTISMR